MEQFYYFAADGRRNGPLPLSILKKLAQGEQIFPETTLEAEDGRRFRADKKLAAADFGGRTTEAPRSVRATRQKRRSALGASENNGTEPTAPNERKRGVAKVLRLAAGVGLATTICVMGATLGFASLAALFWGE